MKLSIGKPGGGGGPQPPGLLQQGKHPGGGPGQPPQPPCTSAMRLKIIEANVNLIDC